MENKKHILIPRRETIPCLAHSYYNRGVIPTDFILPLECEIGDIFEIYGLFTIYQNQDQVIEAGVEPILDDNGNFIYQLFKFVYPYEDMEWVRDISSEEYLSEDFLIDMDKFVGIKSKTIFTTKGSDGYLKSNNADYAIRLIYLGQGRFLCKSTCGDIEVK